MTSVMESKPGHPDRSEWRHHKAEEHELLLSTFGRKNLHWGNVDWVVVGWMAAMHVGALIAIAGLFTPWRDSLFSSSALAVTAFLHWLTCSYGVCLTLHRYLSHRSLKLRNPARFLGLFSATIAGEGTPLQWAAVHRIHHQKSDQPGDPHSPKEGDLWSHLLWMFTGRDARLKPVLYSHFVPDLAQDPMMLFFEKWFMAILIGTGVALYAIGGWPMFLWGMCVRMVLAYHSTWMINSVTHMWGYRSYETSDMSRNLWWVSILAYGEGWHNNHHAYPRLARSGFRWWEFDPTWLLIAGLRLIGQAYDVDDRRPEDLPMNKGADPLKLLEAGKNRAVPPVKAL